MDWLLFIGGAYLAISVLAFVMLMRVAGPSRPWHWVLLIAVSMAWPITWLMLTST